MRLFISILLLAFSVGCQPQQPHEAPSPQQPAPIQTTNDTNSTNAQPESDPHFAISYKDYVQPNGSFATFLADETSTPQKMDPSTLVPIKVTIIEESGVTTPPITWVEAYTTTHLGHFEFEICSQVLSDAEKNGLPDNGCARGRVRWDKILLDNYYTDYYHSEDPDQAGLQIGSIEGRATMRIRQCVSEELTSSIEETCGPWVVKDFYHRHNTAGPFNIIVKERDKLVKQMTKRVEKVHELIIEYKASREAEKEEHCKETKLPREVIAMLNRVDLIEKALQTLKPIGFSEGLGAAKRTFKDLQEERKNLQEEYAGEQSSEERQPINTRFALRSILTRGGSGGFNPDTLDEIGDSIMPIIQETVMFEKLTKPQFQIDCNRDSHFADVISEELTIIAQLQDIIAQYTVDIEKELEDRKKSSTP